MYAPSLPDAVIIYAGLNLLAFAVFTYDKLRATVNIRRTPENTLLLLAALGPFGALAAVMGFRHKTRHAKFFLIPVFAILHGIFILWLWSWAA